MITKRACAILVAVSKSSSPSPSPISTWSFAVKSNFFGSPTRRTSTLASALRPAGTLACGTLGTCIRKSLSRCCTSSSLVSSDFNCSACALTSAISTEASSFFALSWPICLDSALRFACSSWVSVWMVLRSASSAANCAVSSVYPRSARRAATACTSVLSVCISSISVSNRSYSRAMHPASQAAPQASPEKSRHYRRVHRLQPVLAAAT